MTSPLADRVFASFRQVPDFPTPGILFQDIMPLFANPPLLREAIDALSESIRSLEATHLVGIESRGFLLAAPLALRLSLPLVPARKLGKLPPPTYSVTYELEYGKDHIEMSTDSLPPGSRVVVVDDVLATGGTAQAVVTLLEQTKSYAVGAVFLLEIRKLNGRNKLSGGGSESSDGIKNGPTSASLQVVSLVSL